MDVYAAISNVVGGPGSFSTSSRINNDLLAIYLCIPSAIPARTVLGTNTRTKMERKVGTREGTNMGNKTGQY